MDDDFLKISPPIYMVGMKIGCWRCGERMPVVALLAPTVEGADDQVCVLSDVVALPKDLLGNVQKRVPTYQLKYSKTAQDNYYANVCPRCRMLSGVFFLHSEPGAPFFPTCEEKAGLLYPAEIPVQGPVRIRAGFQVGTGRLILKHAKRILLTRLEHRRQTCTRLWRTSSPSVVAGDDRRIGKPKFQPIALI
jgi:hypothetical protein